MPGVSSIVLSVDRITLGNQLDGVHLLDPEVVERFMKKYPDGNCMKSNKSWYKGQCVSFLLPIITNSVIDILWPEHVLKSLCTKTKNNCDVFVYHYAAMPDSWQLSLTTYYCCLYLMYFWSVMALFLLHTFYFLW